MEKALARLCWSARRPVISIQGVRLCTNPLYSIIHRPDRSLLVKHCHPLSNGERQDDARLLEEGRP
jgi:hypothetical protein